MLLFQTRTLSVSLIAAIMLAAISSQAATVASFDVVLTGDISGVAPGAVNADPSNDPSGFGLGGSATLDDAGILTIQYRANAVTGFTNTVQNAEAIFTGSFGGGSLASPVGSVSCSRLHREWRSDRGMSLRELEWNVSVAFHRSLEYPELDRLRSRIRRHDDIPSLRGAPEYDHRIHV